MTRAGQKGRRTEKIGRRGGMLGFLLSHVGDTRKMYGWLAGWLCSCSKTRQTKATCSVSVGCPRLVYPSLL